ncbi:MAG TPA: Fic family protein [Gemmataceae bacterium]|nr:Fic family protein [Gemmataceae bacterium]
MRLPQRPPDWLKSIGDNPNWLVDTATRADVQAFVRDANDRYLHWDRLRFQPMPSGLTAPQAWAAVMITRNPQRQRVPLTFDAKTKLWYWIPPRHHEWISLIDQRAGGFLGSQRPGLPGDNDYYLFNSLMEEAIASSQLEGAHTTREIAKEMLRTNRQPRGRAEQMIANNYAAILEIRDLKTVPLTPELLCHLQQVLTRQTLDNPDAAGRFRRADEQIYIADADNEPVYTPPAADGVPARVQELCDFANAASVPFVHPVLKAIALHFAIGFIHPFVDGNGRTARAVFYWYMLKHGYWLFEFLPISRIIKNAPAQYGKAYLYVEAGDGDLTYFNHYHLEVIIRAIDELHTYLAGQQEMLSEAEALVEAHPALNLRQRLVVSEALRHPNREYTVRTYVGAYRVTANTARSDLAGLERLGLFEAGRVAHGKAAVYRPAGDLKARLRSPSGQRVGRIRRPPRPGLLD